jgi:hypothetical protein
MPRSRLPLPLHPLEYSDHPPVSLHHRIDLLYDNTCMIGKAIPGLPEKLLLNDRIARWHASGKSKAKIKSNHLRLKLVG